jgi:cell division protein FtsI/penicillin-binding protein 2
MVPSSSWTPTQEPENAENLALRATYPAASVFKIITATAAMDRYKISPDTLIMYSGGNHTLYRQNVLYNKPNRWSREITLREAFARSINTIFARLTLEKMEPKDIEDYAIRFGFNKPIKTDLPVDPGFTQVPQEKSFALAEIVSGYNRITRMSPVQGAMIASSVAAVGVMRVPYIVQDLRDENNQIVWKPEPVTAAVTMTGEGAERLKDLMEATITEGTSRKSFRALIRDGKFSELELGGKTGSLHGDNPKGKVDWFVGYAIGGKNDRLAIGAITVNKEFWTVKASYLAQSLFKKHFKDQFTKDNSKFFNAKNDQQ